MLTARKAPKACLSCRSQLLALFEYGFTTRPTVPVVTRLRGGNGKRTYLTSGNLRNREAARGVSTGRGRLAGEGGGGRDGRVGEEVVDGEDGGNGGDRIGEDGGNLAHQITPNEESLAHQSLGMQGKEKPEEITNFEREVPGDMNDEAELDRLDDEQETKNYEFGLEFAEELVEADKLLRTDKGTETVVKSAREKFGQYLPEGLLTMKESAIYERLYGKPAKEVEPDEEMEEVEKNTLLRENEQGLLEEVEYNSEVDLVDMDPEGGYTGEVDIPDELEKPRKKKSKRQKELDAKWQLEKDIDAALAQEHEMPSEEGMEDEELDEDELDEEDEEIGSWDQTRTHPNTMVGRFGTSPSTIQLPKETFVSPIIQLLHRTNPRHLLEASFRAFGGPGIPHSASTPLSRKLTAQKHIGLEAGQFRMSEIEADAYLACVLPATYATVSAVLVETRKRLGRPWLQNLLTKADGPQVLDAGAGGAGLLAWREIIEAEWDALKSDGVVKEDQDIPVGRQTVLTGSFTLRHRMSTMLQDTTFLPRLPDYIHASNPETSLTGSGGAAESRKKYDVIIAPHTLLPLKEDFKRRNQVDNLWSLLNPEGGILILIEKGIPRGFEAIAGARSMLLKNHISSPHDALIENQIDEQDTKGRYTPKEKGMIVAPCTNHLRCPMYRIEGLTEGRKDFCHFNQRFIRPPFLQKIVGASSRNHEDVRYSYLVVRRGVDYRQDQEDLPSVNGPLEQGSVIQGEEATKAAFAGYETPFTIIEDGEEEVSNGIDEDVEIATTRQQEVPETNHIDIDNKDDSTSPPFTPFNIPRLVLPPLKRHQHVTLDLCTPSGTLERWTIPKSFSLQAYRDARKSKWGDLWALGAKVRVEREPRLGRKGMMAGQNENEKGKGLRKGNGVKGNGKGKIARGRKKGGVDRFEVDVDERGLQGIREVSGGRVRDGKRMKGGRRDRGGGVIREDDL